MRAEAQRGIACPRSGARPSGREKRRGPGGRRQQYHRQLPRLLGERGRGTHRGLPFPHFRHQLGELRGERAVLEHDDDRLGLPLQRPAHPKRERLLARQAGARRGVGIGRRALHHHHDLPRHIAKLRVVVALLRRIGHRVPREHDLASGVEPGEWRARAERRQRHHFAQRNPGAVRALHRGERRGRDPRPGERHALEVAAVSRRLHAQRREAPRDELGGVPRVRGHRRAATHRVGRECVQIALELHRGDQRRARAAGDFPRRAARGRCLRRERTRGKCERGERHDGTHVRLLRLVE